MQRQGFKYLACIGLLALLAGCETIGFYTQAVAGQLRLLHARQPIDKVLQSPQTQATQRTALTHIRAVAQFAEQDLGLLPDKAYSSFVQLEAPYVVWNVFAAPRLSLAAKTWCYPIAGCASYRGYFAKEKAEHYAKRLRQKGFDVSVSGVRAYSTLGWFDDPVLSSFLDYSPPRQAGLIFHELAHKRVYIAGDTDFNESFATAVEQAGLKRWLLNKAGPAALHDMAEDQAKKRRFLAMVAHLRARLTTLYANERLAESEKLVAKAKQFDAFKQALHAWGEPAYLGWAKASLNNAHLVPLHSYHRWVCAFEHVQQQSADFDTFFSTVDSIAVLGQQERLARLRVLATEGGCELQNQ